MDEAEKFINKRGGRKIDNKLLLFMIISIFVFAVPDLMAGQVAQIAEQMLEERCGIIVEVPAELMKTGLLSAVDVVKYDYSEELATTLDYVAGQLGSHGVKSQLSGD